MSVEEEERREGLVLGGGRDAAVRRERGQERVDLRLAHRVGVALAVEEDEPLHPRDVGLFGAEAVVARAERGTHAVEELHPLAEQNVGPWRAQVKRKLWSPE